MLTRLKLTWPKLMIAASMMLLISTLTSPAFGQATSITSTGFRATEGGGGAITAEYTTGNLGNTWAEGEWVSYQLIISNVQTDYPNLVDFPMIKMSYDYTSKGHRFVDLVRAIQISNQKLVNGEGYPMGDGTAYPVSTREEIEIAQNEPNENVWNNFELLNLPDVQMNRALDLSEGTPDDAEHVFYITRDDVIAGLTAAGLPMTVDTIIIFYQLHESRSFVWFNALESQYDAPPTDHWGGYLYGTAPYAADSRNGSGWVPGSSGHIEVEFASGAKTVPIPIPERLPGAVSGLKWRDQNGDGVMDMGEETLSGWRIFVEGTLENINFETSTLTDEFGDYSFPNLTSNVVWTISEDVNRENPFEDDFMQTYPMPGAVVGVGTGIGLPADPSLGDYGWEVALTRDFPDQGDMNFGNKQCELVILCPPTITINCTDPDGPSFTGSPTVESNCDPVLTDFTDNTIPGDCVIDGYLYQIERTWTATDALGQVTTCTQVITVTDSTPPVISGVGADFTIECDQPLVFSDPTVSDECDPDPGLAFEDVTTPGSCPQEYSVTRTWTATDHCGNTSMDSQTIFVVDTTDPVISGVGADFTIECDQDPIFSDPTVSDNCDPDPGMTFADVTTPGSCPEEYSITRTWTATDACGNSSTDSQTIFVVDTTDPVISGVGDDYTIECDQDPVFSNPTVSDNCDPDPGLTFNDVTTPGSCPEEYSITRTWTATDACGNSSTDSQIIYVVDTTDPVISGVGDDYTIECTDDPVFSDPTVSDNCDPDPSLTFEDVTTPGDCPQEYSVTRTWTATDACGNSSTDNQTVYIVDTTPPAITCPNDVDFNCDAVGDFGMATAVDACDPDPAIGYTDDTLTTSCPIEINRTWTATDACGNSASCVQHIIIRDETPPVISGVGADFTIECDQDPIFSDPTASDNCDPDPSLTFNDVTTPGSCPQEYSITRTWTATDFCGNTSQDSQTIFVVDTTDPVISGVGDDYTIECDQDPVFSDPTASDNCDPDPSLTFNDVTTPGSCPQEHSITRTWTATDACGNTSSDSQTIYVVDTTDPVISGVGSDYTVECPDGPVFSDPTASDNCDPDPSLTFEDVTTPGDCPQEYSVTRTWTATDACGNSSTDSQTIYVVDTTPPAITCPDDVDFNCDAVGDFGVATAIDACDPDPAIDYTDDTLSTACPLEISRTWTATDACDNSASCVQLIIIRDETPPVISGVGADYTIECTEDPIFSDPTASDNCDPDPSLTFVDSTFGGSCPQAFSIKRTWTATDFCGNESKASQTIIIVDTAPPVISGVGADTTFNCTDDPVFSTPTASDLCDLDPSLTFNDVTTPGDCPQEYSITRTWTATDACGNSSSMSQTLHVVDDTAPVISGVGADTTISCDTDPVFSDPTAADDCDPDPSLTHADDTTMGDCPYAYSITRTWTATDTCGNSATASQTITVEDSEAPMITCAPDSTIECEGELVFTPPTAEDNCDPDPMISMISYDSTAGPGDGQMSYVKCWVATDTCGNVSDTCCQTIIREPCETGCTFTIGGWGNGCPESQMDDMYSTQPGCVRDHYFSTVFSGEVVVGHNSGYTARWTSAMAVREYLPAGSTPAILTGDFVNPSTDDGNVLVSQILALTLNREYICSGVFYDLGLWPDMGCYGNHMVGDCGGGMFDALTVDEFLAFANKVVSGKTNMLNGYGATLSDVNYTATCLNELYSDCDPYADIVVVPSFDVAENDDDMQDPSIPTEYGLNQNSPNPFNPVTQINFSLPEASYVRLTVYNILGQVVVKLVDGHVEAGYHTVSWNGNNVASGVYLYRLVAEHFVSTKKMVLMK